MHLPAATSPLNYMAGFTIAAKFLKSTFLSCVGAEEERPKAKLSSDDILSVD